MELDGKVLVLRRIRVRYAIPAPEDAKEAVDRVHEIHADHCPVARSLRGSIAIETGYELA